MTKVLRDALVELEGLPESDQEKIGLELIEHVRRLRSLRADLSKGLSSLNAGRGKAIDVEDVIRRARSGRAKG